MFRKTMFLVAAMLPTAQASAAMPPPSLARDLGRLLEICQLRDPDLSTIRYRKAGWEADPETGRQQAVGPYGTIAIVAGGARPCELSFELTGATMADVRRVVAAWVKANDAGASYRDRASTGGNRSIWALKDSTLRLEYAEAPTRGQLKVNYFPSAR
jgi:hypothetical protein